MRKSKRDIGSDLRKVDAHVIAPHEYEEAPELTDEQLAKAFLSVGGKRRGRPLSERPKRAVKLRLDADVINAYRETGKVGRCAPTPICAVPANSTRRNARRRRVRAIRFRCEKVRRTAVSPLVSWDPFFIFRSKRFQSPRPKRLSLVVN